jgi:hypothetical protein
VNCPKHYLKSSGDSEHHADRPYPFHDRAAFGIGHRKLTPSGGPVARGGRPDKARDAQMVKAQPWRTQSASETRTLSQWHLTHGNTQDSIDRRAAVRPDDCPSGYRWRGPISPLAAQLPALRLP